MSDFDAKADYIAQWKGEKGTQPVTARHDKATTLPDWIDAFEDSDWRYYVPDRGDLEDSFGPIGYPDEFVYERVWMRPVPASSLDFYDGPTTARGADGRFESVTCWIECSEGDSDATAFYGTRYA